MKTLLAVALAIISQAAIAITPEEAANHVGEIATVEGVVSGVVAHRNRNSYLNFGESYPNQIFSAKLLPRSGIGLGAKEYHGKTVSVTGKVRLYRGKAQITVGDKDQVKIVEAPKP